MDRSLVGSRPGQRYPAEFMKGHGAPWRIERETYISTLEARSQAPPRLSRADGNQGRPPGDRAAPGQGPQAALRLMDARGSSPTGIERLKRRADFLAAAKGKSLAMAGVVVQARERTDSGPARVGFTVTK